MIGNLPANAGDAKDGSLVAGLGRSLEWEMAAHSCVLAWGVPRIGEPGGLWSTRSQRVGCD